MLDIFRGLEDHTKLSLREIPDHLILHVGTNNLNSDPEPKLIAKVIVDVNLSVKKEKYNLTISNIIIRNGDLKKKQQKLMTI